MKKVSKKSPFATKHDVQTIVDKGFEKFAIVMKRSFDDIELRLVTKDEFVPFRDEMIGFKKSTEQTLYEIQSDTSDLRNRMGRVENRLDVLENKMDDIVHVYKDHEKRITRVETKFA